MAGQGQDFCHAERCSQFQQPVHRKWTRPKPHPWPACLAFGLVREAPHSRRPAWGRYLLPQQAPAGVDHLQQQPTSSDCGIGLVAKMPLSGAASGLQCRALSLVQTRELCKHPLQMAMQIKREQVTALVCLRSCLWCCCTSMHEAQLGSQAVRCCGHLPLSPTQ